MSSVEERFIAILHEIKPEGTGWNKSTNITETGFDSFEFLRLIASIEHEFDVYFNEDDLLKQHLLSTVQDFLTLIEEKLEAGGL